MRAHLQSSVEPEKPCENCMQNGYQQISDYLARGLDIRLGNPVTEIEHDDEGVTVTTADGTNFTCGLTPISPLFPFATVESCNL